MPTDPALCRHCEKGPGTSDLGLCAACHAKPRVRRTYVRRRSWSPAWEEHLLELRRRAEEGKALFAWGVVTGVRNNRKRALEEHRRNRA